MYLLVQQDVRLLELDALLAVLVDVLLAAPQVVQQDVSTSVIGQLKNRMLLLYQCLEERTLNPDIFLCHLNNESKARKILRGMI